MNNHHDRGEALSFPIARDIKPGELLEVAPGALLLRFAIPFSPGDLNVYLISDGDGWAVFDSGLNLEDHIATWTMALEGPLRGERITRVIVSHYHSDHIGLAGWLCRTLQVPMLTSRATYLSSQNLLLNAENPGEAARRNFYTFNGMTEQLADFAADMRLRYKQRVVPLPPTYTRLRPGETLAIGERVFEILHGEGHAPEQVMLYCREEGLFFAADQVIERISPNISVSAIEPDDNPLGQYLESLSSLQQHVSNRVVVMPGHRRPFYGLPQRCTEVIEEHRARCGTIVNACETGPKTVAELAGTLFRDDLPPVQHVLAFGETMAHVNLLVAEGRLRWRTFENQRKVVSVS